MSGVNIKFANATYGSVSTLNKSLFRGTMKIQFSHLDEAQGADEQRTEPYLNTVREQSQSVTPRFAKSDGGAFGYAERQANTVGEL
jgi:hypothetical protein